MHIRSLLHDRKIETTIDCPVNRKKQQLTANSTLWIHKSLEVSIKDDKVVINSSHPCYKQELVRLADPECFEIVVKKIIELQDEYEWYKRDKHDNQIPR